MTRSAARSPQSAKKTERARMLLCEPFNDRPAIPPAELEVRFHLASGDVTPLVVKDTPPLFIDDTVYVARLKIHAHYTSSPDHRATASLTPADIYMWTDRAAIGLVLRADDGSPYEGTHDPYARTFGVSSDGEAIATVILDDAKTLGFYFERATRRAEQILHVTTFHDLVTYLANTAEKNAMHEREVSEILRNCFPRRAHGAATVARYGPLQASADAMMVEFSRLSKKSSSHVFNVTCAVENVTFGEIATWRGGADLDNIFNALEATEAWPLIKMVSSGAKGVSAPPKVMYKLHVPTGVVFDVLQRWLSSSSSRFPHIEVMVALGAGDAHKEGDKVWAYMSIKIYAATPQGRTMVMGGSLSAFKNAQPNGVPIHEIIDRSGALRSRASVRALVHRVRTVALGKPIPASSVPVVPVLKYLRVLSQVHSTKIDVDFEIMKQLAARLSPFLLLPLEETSGDGTDRLTFMFPRTPDFYSCENVARIMSTAFADLMETMPPEKAIANALGLSEEEARRCADEMRTIDASGHVRQPSGRPQHLCKVQLARATTGEVSVKVEWANGVATHRSLMTIVCFLMFFSDKAHARQLRQSKVFAAAALAESTPDDTAQRRSPPSPMFEMGDDTDILDLEDVEEEDGGVGASLVAGTKPPSDKKSFQKYALKSLQRADPEVFDVSYSRACQKSASRQPIVVTRQELDVIDRSYPGSYFGNYIADFGSDARRRATNIYICPEYWCPLSRVSMTDAQLKAAGGRCPHPNEPVMHIDNPYFHTKKGDGGQKTRIASFTKKSKCYPCCFAPMSSETSASSHAARIEKCVDPVAPAAGELSSERYVKGSAAILEPRRYGALPDVAMGVLPTMKLPGGANGTGVIGASTDCLVRVGVGEGSFVQSVEWLLHESGFGKVDLIGLICENLTIEAFMSVRGGRLLRMFVNESRLSSPTAPRRFYEWATKTENGRRFVEAFGLRDAMRLVAADLAAADLEGSSKFPCRPEYARAFVMWSAYDSFMAFLRDKGSWKSELAMLDLVNHTDLLASWLGAKRTKSSSIPTFIVCEADTSSIPPAFFVVCDGAGEASAGAPFSLILKQRHSIFEPLARVRWQSKSGGTVFTNAVFAAGDYVASDAVHQFFWSHVREGKKSTVRAAPGGCAILDHNFSVVGHIPITSRDGKQVFMFLDELQLSSKGARALALSRQDIERARDEHNIFIQMRQADAREVYHVRREREKWAMSILLDLCGRDKDVLRARDANAFPEYFARKAVVTRAVVTFLQKDLRAKAIAKKGHLDLLGPRLSDEIAMSLTTSLSGDFVVPQWDDVNVNAKQHIVFDQAYASTLLRNYGNLANKYVGILNLNECDVTTSRACRTMASTPQSPMRRTGTRKG